MSSWKKIVEGGTKPKNAPPKAKYIDPIVQASFSQDGSLQDICRSLAPKLRDSNSIVVFKSLLIVHTLLRVGSLQNVFGYLASDSQILRLKDVISGFDTANTLNLYAGYLHVRLKTYAALGHDVIRDKSDRVAPSRLRRLTVDKGLLREVGMVERLMNALVKCKFYLDGNIEDELTMSALRLLVKDLLVLFQVLNEGVINVLEHYFEMSHVDASKALKIYKSFCSDTEMVVAYLGIAKKLQHIINVDIPNLKHAPVSLAKSLEEYLNDPNFEQNRLEYKEASKVADGSGPKTQTKAPVSKPAQSKPEPTPSSSSTSTGPSLTVNTQPPPGAKPSAFLDFFSTIEQEQQSMFNPNPGNASPSTAWFQQNAAINPFMMQQQPQGAFVVSQSTTFLDPTQTQGLVAQPTGAFAMMQAPSPPQQQVQSPFGAFMQPQPTGLLPQMTGANPFRQSTLGVPGAGGNPFGAPQMSMPIQPQPTGAFASVFAPSPVVSAPTTAASLFMSTATPTPPSMAPSGAFGAFAQQQQQQTSPFAQSQPQPQQDFSSAFSQPQSQTTGSSFSNAFGQPSPFAPSPAAPASMGTTMQPPARSATSPNPFGAPAASNTSSTPKPLVAQKTGTRNPFALPSDFERKETPPPLPPSLNDLIRGASPFPPASSATSPPVPGAGMMGGGTMMGNIASEFALMRTDSPSNLASPSTNTSAASPAMNGMDQAPAPLRPQITGGVKPFVPSSAFGAELLKSSDGGSFSSPVPPLPSASAFSSMPTGTSTSSAFSSMPTGTSTTSAFSSGTTNTSTFSSSNPIGTTPAPLQPTKTGFGGSTVKPFQPSSSFGASLFSSTPTSTPSGTTPFSSSFSSAGTASGAFASTNGASANGSSPFPTSFNSAIPQPQAQGSLI
ncbi:hypothetical protein BT69DRAFT_485273 [Atractiella rhizophila]|nr:hypothetical protein BT69DRAFT_485273 [Atractiella rhizophila]